MENHQAIESLIIAIKLAFRFVLKIRKSVHKRNTKITKKWSFIIGKMGKVFHEICYCYIQENFKVNSSYFLKYKSLKIKPYIYYIPDCLPNNPNCQNLDFTNSNLPKEINPNTAKIKYIDINKNSKIILYIYEIKF